MNNHEFHFQSFAPSLNQIVMNAKEFLFKAELLTDAEVEQIANSIVSKLLQHVPGLGENPNHTVEEPIKMRDICRLLQISDTTARGWMSKGTLPFHRKGNRVYFFKSEVLKSLEQPLKRRA